MARSTNPTMSRSAVLSWFTARFLKSSAKAPSSSKLLLELMIALFSPKISRQESSMLSKLLQDHGVKVFLPFRTSGGVRH